MSAPLTANTTTQNVMDLESQYLLQNYARYPLVLHRGKGCYVYDVAGNRYLDFISGIGVNALGHAHPRIVKVIREQAALLMHCSNLYYHEYPGTAGEEAGRDQRACSARSSATAGTEAMEGALKMVRAHGNKISPKNTRSSRSTILFTAARWARSRSPGSPSTARISSRCCPACASFRPTTSAALEQAVSEHTAGIVMELIQGEGGIYPLTHEFTRKARELADRYNALLVFDEIQCGVGRPGTYFAYQLASPAMLPDVMVAAKPLACGMPLGVIMANEKAAAAIGPGMHGSTFGGGALACRVALEFFDILDELLPHDPARGRLFPAVAQRAGQRKHSFIREVRGFGLMIGVEMEIPGKQMVLDAMADGLLINCTHDTVLRFLPPYIVTEKEVDAAMKVLGEDIQ